MPKSYPISLQVENRLCLVVGGGAVAERKVQSLLECGALLRLISPEITPGIRRLINTGKIEYTQGRYSREHLRGVFLVVGATDCEKTNQQISTDSNEMGLLFNIVDDPSRCNFYVPAVVKRGSLQIAVSTDGKSPLLARKIREQLEPLFPDEFEDVVNLLGDLRQKIIQVSAEPHEKKALLNSLLDHEVMELLRKGKFDQAKERIQNAYLGGGSKPQDCTR